MNLYQLFTKLYRSIESYRRIFPTIIVRYHDGNLSITHQSYDDRLAAVWDQSKNNTAKTKVVFIKNTLLAASSISGVFLVNPENQQLYISVETYNDNYRVNLLLDRELGKMNFGNEFIALLQSMGIKKQSNDTEHIYYKYIEYNDLTRILVKCNKDVMLASNICKKTFEQVFATKLQPITVFY